MKQILHLLLCIFVGGLISSLSGAPASKESSISALVRNLNNKDSRKKAHAVMSLAYLGHTESIESIRKLLSDKKRNVINAAVNALALFSDTQSTTNLYKLFTKSQKNKTTQQAILKAFKTVNDDKTVDFILKYLPLLEPSSAQIAFETLQKIQDPPLFETDSGRQSLDSFNISGYIGQGKSTKIKIDKQFFGIADTILDYKITAIDIENGIVKLEKDNEIFSKEIDTSEQNDLEKSIQNLNSKDDKVVYKALLNLIYHRSNQASEELMALAKGNNDPNITLAAIYALGQCEVMQSEDFLRKLLNKSKSIDQIIVAAESLSLIGDENSLDSLDSLVQHRSAWVRNAVISAIGYFESPNSLSTLVRGLSDKFSFVRQNSYNQLIQLVSGDTVGTLASILGSDTQNPSEEKLKLLDYISNIASTGNASNPFSETKTKRIIPPKIQGWKPSFIILNFGQVQSKSIVTVIEKAKELNLGKGDFVEGREILEIDVDDESLIVKDGDKEVTLIKGGEDTPAEILE